MKSLAVLAAVVFWVPVSIIIAFIVNVARKKSNDT